MTDYTSKVAAGIKVLDREVPNWRAKVDLDRLDLGSCSVCVLGQVFGDYEDGVNALDIDPYDHAFNTTGSMVELTNAWKEALGTNKVLVEKGDVYKDRYGYAVKVTQTTLVKIKDDEVISTYIVESGTAKSNGVFTAYKSSSGKPELLVLQKKDFENGGTYSTKVDPALKIEQGMFIETSDGKKYFVHSKDEVRELKDGAYAVSVHEISLSGAKELMTGMGVKFAKSVKNSLV